MPTAAAIVACSALAAYVVIRHLGTKPLWRDETISLSVATRPALRILSVLPHHDANAGLYYLLLHLWVTFGTGRGWIRGLSALCFVATTALAAWAGGRWRGWQTALALGLLVALNPFLLYYGQEARPYALAVVLATASTIALFWQGDGRGVRPANGVYTATTIALLYADLFAVLYVGAVAVAVVAMYRLRGETVPAVLKRSWWIIAVVVAPLAIVMVGFERGQISWLSKPTLGVLATTITSMSAGWLGLALVVGLAAIAAAGSAATSGLERTVVAAMAAAFVLPPLALWTVAQITPVFIDRYVICSTVGMLALAVAGLVALRDRLRRTGGLVGMAVLAALLVVAAQGTAHMEAEPFKVDNGPAVVTFVEARTQPGDAVAYAGGGLRTLIDTMLAEPRSQAAMAFPPDVALAPHGQAFYQDDLYAREVSAPVLTARLATVERLWLITDPSDQSYPQGGPFATLKRSVLATYGPDGTWSFGSVDVTLLVRRL